ncbi:MAG: metal-dependent hydrolase [Gammaproteobacteria bacterium]|nr:metal-dependent hydrolase [Gammaproteobacteria bacterium]
MDIVTQGLLGAGLAQSAAGKDLRAATAVGFAAGLLPDADGLIRSGSDPLLFLEFHRHFTHALVFVPIGAALATLLLWPFFRRRMSLMRLYVYAFLGYSLAGVLDACTSYGTHLLWPFSDTPVAWGIVAIVDPVFSLILLAAVGIGIYSRHNTAARTALLLAGAYLVFGAWQQQRVEAVALALAADRGQTVERLLAKPTLGNLVLWRTLYVADGTLHADAVRMGLVGDNRIYEGQSRPLLRPEDVRHSSEMSFRSRDMLRFANFADGLLVRHPTRAGMIGDARFAMLPTQLRPLWGIESDTAAPSAGARFVTDRSMSRHERQQFIDMLLGRSLTP